MENYLIQMVFPAGHAVAYAIALIFKHIIDCMQLYFTNVLSSVNCLWLFG